MAHRLTKGKILLLTLLLLLAGYFSWMSIVPQSDDIPVESIVIPPGPIGVDVNYAGAAAYYVGAHNCRECHIEQYDLWRSSHHDMAMDVADEKTVLGDFNDVVFTHHGITSRFFRRGDKFIVHTEGLDGQLNDYAICYVFGYTPLQQYLVEFPGGRFQCLPLCWDSRPEDEGGQRWFHIYGDQRIGPDDELFWTGPVQNWNFMCAECHSTNLKKNYDPDSREYNTTFSEIDVSCEACHGPGSEHLRWAMVHQDDEAYDPDDDMGLVLRLKNPDEGGWEIDQATNKPVRTTAIQSQVILETCGRCHSRRSLLDESYVFGRSLHDTHRVSLLIPKLYHADGQILDEVYVYGSFVQSVMYRKGVRCVDCHDPHSLELLFPASQVCLKCHVANLYDTKDHHFHEPGEEGSKCVDCHMIQRKYMGVDSRYDHSFRVPRPDLSVLLDTPNACSDCHSDQSYEWSADYVRQWYGQGVSSQAHYGQAIHMGRQGNPRARGLLTELILDQSQPAIVRATGLKLLTRLVTPAVANIVINSLEDPDPMVRTQAVAALEVIPPEHRRKVIARMLKDSVKSVRIEAARVLALSTKEDITGEYEHVYQKVLAEYIDVQLANAERGSAHLNLGILYVQLGEYGHAEAAYKEAIEIEPLFLPAYINLADLYRIMNRESMAEAVLRAAIELSPQSADAYYALGMSLVRQKRMVEVLDVLVMAVQYQNNQPQYIYAYGVALYSMGQVREALSVLKMGHELYPYDGQIIYGLVRYLKAQGRHDRALQYAHELLKLYPEDAQVNEMVEKLDSSE